MDVVIYFGGGGSLGAFDAGVWSALAPRLQAMGARVLAVGGASIGALNAAWLARHLEAADAGVDAFERLWTAELATPSLPFNGPFAWLGDRDARSWNGVLTGLLVGNRRLYRADPTRWNAATGLMRRQRPLMDRSGEYAWLERVLGAIPRAGDAVPLVCVPAVDVLTGALATFDNAAAPLGMRALAASSAIPLLFEPVDIDGRVYWDGDMTRESGLAAVLARLREAAPADPSRPRLLVAVDHMGRAAARLPDAGLEIAHRALELLLAGKTHVPAEDLDGIDHVMRIVRAPMPHDAISGQFDYSPGRIDELIAQGRGQALAAWEAIAPGLPVAVSAQARHAPRPVH